MAIRIDAAGDFLSRTTTLPSPSNFTLMGWGRVMVNQGSGTIQPILSAINGSGTDGITLYWDSSISAGNMRVNCAVGGAETSGTNFASRPAVGDEFAWYIKCSGTGAGLLEAGWRLATSNTWIVAAATLSGSLATLVDWRLHNLLGSFYLNGRLWNVKCWDTVLSGPQLLQESQYEPLIHTDAVNFYWPLPHSGDTFDRGGRFRNATRGGTLTTEPVVTRLLKRPALIKVRSAPSADVTAALTGASSASAAGTLGVGSAIPLVGSQPATSAGTLGVAVTVALSGSQATASAGTLGPATSPALAGSASTVSAGTLAPSASVPLSGQAGTVSAGTLTASTTSDVTVALSGQAVTVSAGALAPQSSVPLAGSASTVSAGIVAPGNSSALAGSASTSGTGTLAPAASIPLIGQSLAALAGNVLVAGDVTVALTGSAVTVSAGDLSVGSDAVTGGSSGPSKRKYRIKVGEQTIEGPQELIEEILRDVANTESADPAVTEIVVPAKRNKPAITAKTQDAVILMQGYRNLIQARQNLLDEEEDEEALIALLR